MSPEGSESKGRDQRSLVWLDRVSRTYPHGRVRALDGVTLRVERSDYVAITGPSGSGKSTLLYLASGLDQPDSGWVYFDGAAVSTNTEWTRLRARRIGFVFQQFNLISGLTAAEWRRFGGSWPRRCPS